MFSIYRLAQAYCSQIERFLPGIIQKHLKRYILSHRTLNDRFILHIHVPPLLYFTLLSFQPRAYEFSFSLEIVWSLITRNFRKLIHYHLITPYGGSEKLYDLYFELYASVLYAIFSSLTIKFLAVQCRS